LRAEGEFIFRARPGGKNGCKSENPKKTKMKWEKFHSQRALRFVVVVVVVGGQLITFPFVFRRTRRGTTPQRDTESGFEMR
jgi:hypothetical protein